MAKHQASSHRPNSLEQDLLLYTSLPAEWSLLTNSSVHFHFPAGLDALFNLTGRKHPVQLVYASSNTVEMSYSNVLEYLDQTSS